jgi:DNA-binding MarR family transcriptional regulator
MQGSDAVEHAADLLLVGSRALVAIAARSLADLDDVTLPQYRALVVLASRPHVTVNDLADALGISASSVTRLCDRLVRKDLLERRTGATDRRAVELALTPAGRRVVSKVARARRTELVAIAKDMRAADRRALIEGLQAFTDAAREPTGVDLLGWTDPATP